MSLDCLSFVQPVLQTLVTQVVYTLVWPIVIISLQGLAGNLKMETLYVGSHAKQYPIFLQRVAIAAES